MTEPVTNPYLAARIQWNAHVGATLHAARIWQLVAVSALGIAAVAIGGALYLGSRSTFIPYVVEVDQLGQLQAVQIADRASAADERIIHASLANWITSARMVTPDVTLQREAIFKVYALLNPQDPATAKLNAWYGENEESSPFRRAETETVAVEIHSVMPQSETTWRVDWSETTYTRDGAPKAPPQRMTALITVYLVPTTSATTEAEIRKNPLGLFIKDLSWSRQA